MTESLLGSSSSLVHTCFTWLHARRPTGGRELSQLTKSIYSYSCKKTRERLTPIFRIGPPYLKQFLPQHIEDIYFLCIPCQSPLQSPLLSATPSRSAIHPLTISPLVSLYINYCGISACNTTARIFVLIGPFSKNATRGGRRMPEIQAVSVVPLSLFPLFFFLSFSFFFFSV